jgi:hypothetical protein
MHRRRLCYFDLRSTSICDLRYEYMSRKRDKIKRFFGAKSSSSSSVLALAPSAAIVGSSEVSMAVSPTGTSKGP